MLSSNVFSSVKRIQEM